MKMLILKRISCDFMASVELPEKYFSTMFAPRFRDTDRVGHVNNAVFVTYVEIGRVDWWTDIRKRHSGNPMGFIIARVEVNYRAPIHLGAILTVAVWVSKIGNKSWELSYQIFNAENGVLHADSKSVQVGFNYRENKTIEINTVTKNYLLETYNN